MKPKISVIIPIFNAERYLEQCLESVVSQTYKNLEIICINDGSTDSSESILRGYKEKDDRFIIITTENKGGGTARNLAMKISTGEYISFVDSDDWLEPTMYEKMINAFAQNDVDVVYCKWQRFYEKTNTFEEIDFRDKIRTYGIDINSNNTFSFSEIKRVCLINIPNPPWFKLYKKDFLILNNIFFSNDKVLYDNIFSIKSKVLAKKNYFLDETLYNYRKYTRDNVFLSQIDILSLIQSIKDFLLEQDLLLDKKIQDEFDDYVVSRCVWKYQYLPITKKNAFYIETKRFLSKKQQKSFKQKLFIFRPNKFLSINVKSYGQKQKKVVYFFGIKVTF